MKEIDQKIILNSYEIFPIEYSNGIDTNSDKRNAYIKGGLDMVGTYEKGIDDVFNEPPMEDSKPEALLENDSPQNTNNRKQNTLF
jgi:hypothetical protein